MWVRASAMFSVPRVTMNGGRLMVVTRPPFSRPKPAQRSRPSSIARNGFSPELTASLVIAMLPSAMTAPLDRSIPAVRMTSVCPMARVPTTMTCWTMREKLAPVKNRSDLMLKNRQARTSAPSGPSVLRAKALLSTLETPVRVASASAVVAALIETAPCLAGGRWGRPRVAWSVGGPAGRPADRPPGRGSPPAVVEAELHVLRVHTGLWLVGDQRDAGVGVAGHLLPGLGEVDDRVHTEAGHLQRVLLGRGGDLAVLDSLHAGAAAVDGHDHDVLLLAGGLQGRVGAERGGLVDRVDEVDARVLLQAVLHRGLALGLVALGVVAADHLGRADLVGRRLVDGGGPEAVEEAVVPQHAHGDPGLEVQRGDRGWLAAEGGLGVLPDQLAGLEVVGGEQRVHGALRVGRGVEGDDQHALLPRLVDRRDDRLGVARRDQDALDAARHHVLDRGDLAGVVAVELAGRGEQLGPLGLRLLLRALLHLHEERVGVRLRDETDTDLTTTATGRVRAGAAAGEGHDHRHAQADRIHSGRVCLLSEVYPARRQLEHGGLLV